MAYYCSMIRLFVISIIDIIMRSSALRPSSFTVEQLTSLPFAGLHSARCTIHYAIIFCLHGHSLYRIIAWNQSEHKQKKNRIGCIGVPVAVCAYHNVVSGTSCRVVALTSHCSGHESPPHRRPTRKQNGCSATVRDAGQVRTGLREACSRIP